MHEMHFVDCGRVESESRLGLRLAKIDLHGSPYPETKAPSCGWSCRRWRRRSHVGPGRQARGLEVKDVAAGRSEGWIEAEGRVRAGVARIQHRTPWLPTVTRQV